MLNQHQIKTPFINLEEAKKIINQFIAKFGQFSQTAPQYFRPQAPKIPRFSEEQEKEFQFPGQFQRKEEQVEKIAKTLKPNERAIFKHLHNKQLITADDLKFINQIKGATKNIIFDPSLSIVENVKRLITKPSVSTTISNALPTTNVDQHLLNLSKQIQDMLDHPVNIVAKYVPVLRDLTLLALAAKTTYAPIKILAIVSALAGFIQNVSAEKNENLVENDVKSLLQGLATNFPEIYSMIPDNIPLSKAFQTSFSNLNEFSKNLLTAIEQPIPQEIYENEIIPHLKAQAKNEFLKLSREEKIEKLQDEFKNISNTDSNTFGLLQILLLKGVEEELRKREKIVKNEEITAAPSNFTKNNIEVDKAFNAGSTQLEMPQSNLQIQNDLKKDTADEKIIESNSFYNPFVTLASSVVTGFVIEALILTFQKQQEILASRGIGNYEMLKNKFPNAIQKSRRFTPEDYADEYGNDRIGKQAFHKILKQEEFFHGNKKFTIDLIYKHNEFTPFDDLLIYNNKFKLPSRLKYFLTDTPYDPIISILSKTATWNLLLTSLSAFDTVLTFSGFYNFINSYTNEISNMAQYLMSEVIFKIPEPKRFKNYGSPLGTFVKIGEKNLPKLPIEEIKNLIFNNENKSEREKGTPFNLQEKINELVYNKNNKTEREKGDSSNYTHQAYLALKQLAYNSIIKTKEISLEIIDKLISFQPNPSLNYQVKNISQTCDLNDEQEESSWMAVLPDFSKLSKDYIPIMNQFNNFLQTSIKESTSHVAQNVEILKNLIQMSLKESLNNQALKIIGFNYDHGMYEEQMTQLINPNSEQPLQENTQTITATDLTYNPENQIKNFGDKKLSQIEVLGKFLRDLEIDYAEQAGIQPFVTKEIEHYFEQCKTKDEKIMAIKQFISPNVISNLFADDKTKLDKFIVENELDKENKEIEEFLKIKSPDRQQALMQTSFQNLNKMKNAIIAASKDNLVKISPEIKQITNDVRQNKPINFGTLPNIKKLIDEKIIAPGQTDLETVSQLLTYVETVVKLQDLSILEPIPSVTENALSPLNNIEQFKNQMRTQLHNLMKLSQTLPKDPEYKPNEGNFIHEDSIIGVMLGTLRDFLADDLDDDSVENPVIKKNENSEDENSEDEIANKVFGKGVEKQKFENYNPTKFTRPTFNKHDNIEKINYYLENHLPRIHYSIPHKYFPKKKDQLSDLLLDSLQTSEETLKSLPPKKGCLKCGETKNLMVHSQDPNDLTCKACLGKGITSKRFLKEEVDLKPIEQSSKHAELVKSNKLNEAIDNLKNNTAQTTWETFKLSIPKNIKLNFLNRFSKMVIPIEKINESDIDKLVIMLGKWEHDNENCSDILKLNLEHLLSTYLNSVKVKNYKAINPSKMETFTSIKEYLKESPESFLNINTKI